MRNTKRETGLALILMALLYLTIDGAPAREYTPSSSRQDAQIAQARTEPARYGSARSNG